MTTDLGPRATDECRERILFVTGKLAEPALRRVLAELGPRAGFVPEVAVLGITVAALMHADWVRRKLAVPQGIDRVILPGWCQGDLAPLAASYGVPVELGPKDLFDLPEHFGGRGRERPDLTMHDIEILAEINHAPRLADEEVVRLAEWYRGSGADVIDLGCIPGERWSRAGEVTAMLREAGFRVSIDSFDRMEVETAVAAGAELVLSCNGTNVDWASALPAELVVIPDDPHDLASVEPTLDRLAAAGAKYRIDPILEPIGFGFADSVARYYEARRRWPDAELMMGIGNLTELTEVDTAGMNVLLAALCQELGIRSVLTTEVIPWARTAVREFDIARRLVHHAVHQRTLPKHVGAGLVMLRDMKLRQQTDAELEQLAAQITDPNFRIFVEQGEIHLMNRDGYWRARDPFELYDRIVAESEPLDPSHSFYLGYELAKAVTAMTLGKQYTQDQALDWGFLTVPERSAHERRREAKRATRDN